MIDEAPKNKMDIGASKRKAEAPEKVTVRAVSRIKNEYHFPGSGIWEPLAVVATTIEEATKIWKERRKAVARIAEEARAETSKDKDESKTEASQETHDSHADATSHAETKVEEPKETNNE